MFVLSRDVSAAKRVIATLLATAIVLWASGAFGERVWAADLSDVSDLLTDSAPGADSNHTISFMIPSGLSAGQAIAITFPGDFDLASIGEDDVDLELDGVDEPTAAAANAGDWGVNVAGQVLTITSGTATISPIEVVTIKVGTHADGSGTGANQIANPPAPAGGNESYEIFISAGADTGRTRVVILDTVLVTATVETTFNFTVYGLDAGVDVNGETTTASSSSTTIPFGTLVADTPVILAHDLTVESNAINGFVVTVQSDGPLESTNGADIDEFLDDDTAPDVPTAWVAPGDNIADENTWGHWGITSEDQDAADDMRTGSEFANTLYIGASTTPREIFAHNGPADAITPDVGSTTIGYKIEITPLQEAADDYSTVLTYIATPTF